MPEDRTPRKPRSSAAGRSDRPQSGGRPAGGRSGGPGASSGGKPAGRGGRDSGGRDSRDSRDSRDKGGRDFSRPRREDRPARDGGDRTESQARYDGPPIPDEITGRELDRSIAAQLKSLPDKLALRVARHLVAAGLLIDSEPRTAYEHTLAARARASRLSVVREAVGESAYAAGEYAEALSELRAAKRMNGVQDYVAIMADCERALGRPDRALALVKNAPKDKRTLELSHLLSKSREPWVARLRYAYADALLEAGRTNDALTWFHRTEAVDAEGVTDAADRAASLEKLLEPED